MKKHIPNFITSLNLISGCIGIGFLFKGLIAYSAIFIFIAAIFDFFDGLLARLLKSVSEFGKELDSLADVISFGILPGCIMYSLTEICFIDAEGWKAYIPFIAFLIPVCSAIRLAKFNLDTRQNDYFIGLPTPAGALFIASIPLILVYDNEQMPVTGYIMGNPGFLIATTLLLSYLLISPIPLFSFKIKDFSWKNNAVVFIFLISSLILFFFLSFISIPVIFFLYIILSIINNFLKK